MSRTVSQKLAFKLVRMPLSWRTRRLINSALSWKPRQPGVVKPNAELDTLFGDGQLTTSAETLGVDIKGMLAEVSSCRLVDQWLQYDGEFDLDSVPDSVNAAEVVMSERVRARVDTIGATLLDHPVVRGYFGRVPKLTNASIWWSFGGRAEREAQFWHRDIDNIYFLKAFIYLTDVDEDSGPHEYALGSHRWNERLSFERLSPEDMSRAFPGFPLSRTTGPAGSAILEDTFGFHRGTAPAEGKRRCILQYQFAMFPNP